MSVKCSHKNRDAKCSHKNREEKSKGYKYTQRILYPGAGGAEAHSHAAWAKHHYPDQPTAVTRGTRMLLQVLGTDPDPVYGVLQRSQETGGWDKGYSNR